MANKISRADWDYYKNHLIDARSFQEKHFLNKIDVDTYKAYYIGDEKKDQENAYDYATQEEHQERTSLNKVFPATNRVVPTLYYQNHKITFSPRKNATDFSAKLATATIRYDYTELGLKEINQQIIRDAWYAGFGGYKLGYQTNFKYQEQQKSLKDKVKNAFGYSDNKARQIDYIEYEGPWVKRIRPEYIVRDNKSPVGEDRILWVKYPDKTLDDVIHANMYDHVDELKAKYGKKDSREVELVLWEGYCWTRDGLYVVVKCEGFDKPLRWTKSSWKGDGMPFGFLSFAELNDSYYPPPYMKVAYKQQKHINYMATRWNEMINQWRRQVGINSHALTENGKKTVENNDTEGFVEFKGPVTGNMANIDSSPIPPDLFNILSIMQDNLKECMGTSGLRMAGAASDTLGQDQLKEMGNQIVMSGLQDKVAEMVKLQARKMLQMRKQFSTAASLVPIVGIEIMNPLTNQPITEEWLEFGTPENPLTLKEAIAGEYQEEVDVKSAQKPNEGMKLKLFESMMDRMMALEPKLNESGKKIDFPKLTKTWLEMQKDYIPNADSIVVDMTEEERQAYQQSQQKESQTQDRGVNAEIGKTEAEAQKNLADAGKKVAEAEQIQTETEIGEQVNAYI